MKRDKKKINNRLLYSLISLGILIIVIGGVYSYGTSVPTTFGHSVGELDFTGGFNVPSGNVGIGTTTPGSALDIIRSGNTNVYENGIRVNRPDSQGQYAFMGYGQASSDAYFGSVYTGGAAGVYGAIHLRQYSSAMTARDVLNIDSSGNVGIGTPSPDSTLDVHGNAIVTGSLTAHEFLYDSDKSLKENIQPLSSSLDKVKQLQGVSFNWKDTQRKDIGLIAQDVEKVLPEIVHTNKDGLKSVEYGNIVAVLIEAVKEQQDQISELQIEVKELKSQLKE